MNSEDPNEMTLLMPSAWDSFGQWLVYGIIAAIAIAAVIFMYKMLFPGNDTDDKD